MSDPTEAEARLDESRRWIVFAIDSGPFLNGAEALVGHEEMVRAAEREKVRALVEGLTAIARCHCATSSYVDKRGWRAFYTDHTADCPWVEASLWLARDEVPE